MSEENNGVEQNSPSALANAIASSPEALEEGQQAQGTETGTPQQPVSQEKIGFGDPRHPDHERFVELHEQNKWLKQQLELQMQQKQTQQQLQQPTQQPPQELGNTPEEREFWRVQRQIAREEAERATQEKLGQIKPVIDAGRMELAMIKATQFRAEHPDIKPNSPEERAIADKIQMGYLPEDAYKSVMWDTKVANAEKQENQINKQRIEAKKQANVEQKSNSPNSVFPVNEKLSQKERIKREADKLDWS